MFYRTLIFSKNLIGVREKFCKNMKVCEKVEIKTSGNHFLNTVKYSSKNTDEWYTTYETINEEIKHYVKQFENKVVLCNCDNPFESNFCYFFLKNFNILKLKKLICTSCAIGKRDFLWNDLFRNNDYSMEKASYVSKKGCFLSVSAMPGKMNEVVSDEDIVYTLFKEGVVRQLNGSGDFRTDECIKFIKECDICCTNPPFSLFSELFELVMKFDKKFLLIGNQNAITYKTIFPFFIENKVWVGYKFGDMSFRVPADTMPRNTRYWVDSTGQKWRSLGNVMWLTNIDIERKFKAMNLTKKYSPNIYLKYDNFDGINVSRVEDIPCDYFGVMGVPITYLKYHNDFQFEIIGEANHGSDNEFDLFKPIVNGKELFKKILIKRKDIRNE